MLVDDNAMLSDHKTGDSNFPNKPNNTKRNIATVVITAVIVIGIVLAVSLRGDPLAPSNYSSEFYEVTHNETNNYIYLNPKSGVKHEQTMIFLHGYTMTSQMIYNGWYNSAMLGFARGQLMPETTRIIIPQAPVIFNPLGNETTTSWFQLLAAEWNTTSINYNRNDLFNQTALLETRDMVMDIINEEVEKVPNKDHSRIFLGGFSLGCFMSNSILVSYPGPDPLGGIVCTSGLIAIDQSHYNNDTTALEAQKNTPLLLYHGIEDPTVPFIFANETYQYYVNDLKKDQPLELFEFHQEPTLVHTWSKTEWNYIKDWIAKKLPVQ